MDQGVLESIKRRYKKKMLANRLIGENDGVSLLDFFKTLNMHSVGNLVADAWEEVLAETIRKSWKNYSLRKRRKR